MSMRDELLSKVSMEWDEACETDNVLRLLREMGDNLTAQTQDLSQEIDSLLQSTTSAQCRLNNAINNLYLLSYTRFIESRIAEEEDPLIAESSIVGDEIIQQKEFSTMLNLEETLNAGFELLNQNRDKETTNQYDYLKRSLPYYIGSEEFKADEFIGLDFLRKCQSMETTAETLSSKVITNVPEEIAKPVTSLVYLSDEEDQISVPSEELTSRLINNELPNLKDVLSGQIRHSRESSESNPRSSSSSLFKDSVRPNTLIPFLHHTSSSSIFDDDPEESLFSSNHDPSLKTVINNPPTGSNDQSFSKILVNNSITNSAVVKKKSIFDSDDEDDDVLFGNIERGKNLKNHKVLPEQTQVNVDDVLISKKDENLSFKIVGKKEIDNKSSEFRVDKVKSERTCVPFKDELLAKFHGKCKNIGGCLDEEKPCIPKIGINHSDNIPPEEKVATGRPEIAAPNPKPSLSRDNKNIIINRSDSNPEVSLMNPLPGSMNKSTVHITKENERFSQKKLKTAPSKHTLFDESSDDDDNIFKPKPSVSMTPSVALMKPDITTKKGRIFYEDNECDLLSAENSKIDTSTSIISKECKNKDWESSTINNSKSFMGGETQEVINELLNVRHSESVQISEGGHSIFDDDDDSDDLFKPSNKLPIYSTRMTQNSEYLKEMVNDKAEKAHSKKTPVSVGFFADKNNTALNQGKEMKCETSQHPEICVKAKQLPKILPGKKSLFDEDDGDDEDFFSIFPSQNIKRWERGTEGNISNQVVTVKQDKVTIMSSPSSEFLTEKDEFKNTSSGSLKNLGFNTEFFNDSEEEIEDIFRNPNFKPILKVINDNPTKDNAKNDFPSNVGSLESYSLFKNNEQLREDSLEVADKIFDKESVGKNESSNEATFIQRPERGAYLCNSDKTLLKDCQIKNTSSGTQNVKDKVISANNLSSKGLKDKDKTLFLLNANEHGSNSDILDNDFMEKEKENNKMKSVPEKTAMNGIFSDHKPYLVPSEEKSDLTKTVVTSPIRAQLSQLLSNQSLPRSPSKVSSSNDLLISVTKYRPKIPHKSRRPPTKKRAIISAPSESSLKDVEFYEAKKTDSAQSNAPSLSFESDKNQAKNITDSLEDSYNPYSAKPPPLKIFDTSSSEDELLA